MNRTDTLPSVAFFATNDPRNYSGGRYHALIMAYALAHAGCRVSFYTDHVPAFDADLASLAPGGVHFVKTADFRDLDTTLPFDWVILTPTGIFLPDFYAAVQDHAAASGARLALLNFESADWYNTASPHPRDARLWDGWRRACLDGALVLSSTRTSHAHARDFYIAPHASVRHDVWYPPINSPLAERFDGTPRRKLVVGFVRPSDPHKGGRDLLALPPGLLAGHELALVAGRDIDAAYLQAVQQHFAAAAGTRISVHTRISDAAKLQLLSEAKLLLFPSYFEGYGYPPIEALYCGTPVVCYDLPVLRETVGEVAYFAPPGDNAAFAAAAAQALAAPADAAALRSAVYRYAHFESRADALVDLLVRQREAVPVRRATAFRCSLGPVAGTKPRAPGPQDRPPLPAFPFHLTDARQLSDGQFVLTGLVASVPPLDGASATVGGSPVPALLAPADIAVTVGNAYRVHLALPAGVTPDTNVAVQLRGGGELVADESFRLLAAPVDTAAAPLAGVLSVQRVGGTLHVHGWALAGQDIDEVAVSLGELGWFSTSVAEVGPELAEAHPGRASYRAGFILQLPMAELPAGGLDLLLIGAGRTLGLLRGWPQAAAGAVALRRGRRVAPEPQRLHPADLTNSHWHRGVSLFGDARAPSVFTSYDKAAEGLAPGTRLRFASGTVASVVQVQKKQPLFNVFVDRPLNPYVDGHPAAVELSVERRPPAGGLLSFAPDPEGDTGWLNGVRVVLDEHHRRAVRLQAGTPAAAELERGAVLHFAASGERTVLEVDEHADALVVWLDAPVGPVRDGAPQQLGLVSLPDETDELLFPLVSAAHPQGVAHEGGRRSQVCFAAGSGAETLTPGMALRFGGAGVLGIEHVAPGAASTMVTVSGVLDPEADGAPRAVHRLAALPTAPASRRSARYPVADFVAPDPFHLKLAARCAPAQVTAAAPTTSTAGARPRILFLTLVPPIPANQGNRVVTRNLIGHLIELGYDVDCVMQGWIDVPGFIDEFGDRARLYHCAFPNWQDTPEAKARSAAQRALLPALAPLHAALGEALTDYHPYYIVRDEVVDRARTLLQSTRYTSIVCNYLHMARVVKELEDEFELPRACIVTHDALSSLTRRLGHTALDTTYRACTPETERDALNAVADGVVVAISAEERRYFSGLGVALPIVLCEYDAADELASHVLDPRGFGSRTLIYAASRNPLNQAGLGWFLDECWPGVLAVVPDARLIVSGPICEGMPEHLPKVELAGNVERSALLELMRQASVAINPCVVGTGLKIKTVEAACLGLPAVCLPAAVDGLQDVAARFAITAADPEAFTAACISLLTDEARWRALHEGGLSVARARFSHATVYRELDAAMGWTARPVTATGAAPATGDAAGIGAGELDQALASNPAALFELRRERPEDPAVQIALARQLATAGEAQFAHRLAESALAAAPGNPHYAAVTARLAIDAGQPWLGSLHAARLVAGPNGARAEGYALMGEALLALNRLEAAVDTLLQAAAIDPANRAVSHLLAQCFRLQGHHPRLAWALRQLTPPLALGETRLMAADAAGVSHLVSGWSRPEPWGVWSDSDVAVLDFTLAEPVPGDIDVRFVCHGFTAPSHPRCEVTVNVGGTTLGRLEPPYGEPECTLSVRCPAALLNGGRRLVLNLRITEPASPAELGLSPDPRRLGLGLHAVTLDRVRT